MPRKKEIQAQVPLIDKLIPKWARYFDLMMAGKVKQSESYAKKHKLDISDPMRCVIGEVHKFNIDYQIECNTCYNFSYSWGNTQSKSDFNVLPTLTGFIDLNNKIRMVMFGMIKEFDWRNSIHVQEFLKHWNHKHAKISDKTKGLNEKKKND